MKKAFMALVATIGLSAFVSAQYTKDGRPDMRYKSNREMYGGYNSGSYNSSSSSGYNSGYNSSSSTYTNPYTGGQSSYPSYPTKKDGTPDMRYKENRRMYPYGY